MKPEEKIQQLGLELPVPATPLGHYIPALKVGQWVYTSGQLPLVGGKLVQPGGEGKADESNKDEVKQAARVATLNALAAIKQAAGSLECVEQIVKVSVYVASAAGFHAQPYVANGASELIGEVFGEHGKHTRSAIGVAELPINASVELEVVAKLKA
jgi:enamine deaminase RidA (YjgF/YER057c/UK114 family)